MSGLRRAREEDIASARAWMEHKLHSELDSGSEHSFISPSASEDDEEAWTGEIWDIDHLRSYVAEKRSRCVVLIDGYAIDVTSYLGEHVRSSLPFHELITVSLTLHPAWWRSSITPVFHT